MNKSEVGKHFGDLGEKLGKVSEKLESVAEKAEGDIDKEGVLSKAIREAVEAAKNTLSALKGHLEDLKGIGDSKPVGDAENTSSGAAQGKKPDYEELKKVHKAFKGIVTEAVKEGVANPSVGATKLTANNKDGAKILSTHTNGKPGSAVGDKAALILSTVNGAEMLAEIFKSTENDAEITQAATAETTAMSFARGNDGDHLAKQDAAKAAAVAEGIALRSLVKTGTLAANNGGDDKVVQAVGTNAANKLLGAVEDIIKETVKNVLGKAKTKIDEARAPKTVGQK